MGKEVREMRKQRIFLMVSLVLVLLGMSIWGCGPAATPTPPTLTFTPRPAIPPTPTVRIPPSPTPTIAALGISCEQAIAYIGETKTVQGVFYASYRPDVNGQPTFLNCPVPYPNHDFTALIWGENRQKFIDCLGGEPEVLLDQRELGVKGLIEPYEGKVEIILTECGQLTLIP